MTPEQVILSEFILECSRKPSLGWMHIATVVAARCRVRPSQVFYTVRKLSGKTPATWTNELRFVNCLRPDVPDKPLYGPDRSGTVPVSEVA